jgi:hypothetical protein
MTFPPNQPPAPPPPPGQYPPPPGPPPGHYGPPPRKKSKLPWILGGIALVILLCCGIGAVIAVSSGDDADTDAGGSTGTSAPNDGPEDKPKQGKPAAAGIGDPARDGKFEFVVKSVTCGKTRVGNEVVGEDAQGVFCEVAVTVKNIGDEAQMFDGSSQKAFDAKGTRYSNDGTAELWANEGTSTFLEEINPGNQVAGRLIFDVPKGTKLTKVELHDSAFSGGVTINLS